MRILLINDNHSRFGGAEHYFFDLKTRLKEIPDMEVFSLGFGTEEKIGADYLILQALRSKMTKWLGQIIFHPIIFFKIKRYLKKIQPDIIHIHNIKQYSITLLAAIKSYPVVQTIHDYGGVCPIAYNIHKNSLEPCSTGFNWRCFFKHHLKYNLFVYTLLTYTFSKIKLKQQKIIKQFFAPSPLLVDYLKKNNYANVYYIPPFITPQKFADHSITNASHFLFVGQLEPHKGVYLLLEEFAKALEKNKQLTLTFVGTGSHEKKLQEKVKQLCLQQHIFFKGWQNHPELFYRECCAVIFPSIWMEAFGLVLADAMMHGRAVIGSNRGSPLWLIEHQKTGLICNPALSFDLAEKILLLAENTAFAQQLGENGFRKITQLIDNKKTLQTLIGHYQQLSPIKKFRY